MAFILVQHLDPSHPSMMVDLLATATPMPVCQATEGMQIARNHLYVIPPATYLSLGGGALHVSPPEARHGLRLPFDHLLHALAAEYGAGGIAVVLSGTGADGSLGVRAVKERGGLVIVQDPDEAAYDGMPRSAIATGVVDRVLKLREMPLALAERARSAAARPAAPAPHPPQRQQQDHDQEAQLATIVELLRRRTEHDFTLYKPGTLRRRIERRMGMARLGSGEMARYLEILRAEPDELRLLAKDLLINVTSFFRDPKVFNVVAKQVIPGLLRDHTSDQPIRIWVAGCSTGEETYSLLMLFREAMTAANLNLKLQVFASDVDPDAIAAAREGLYPETIAADVSPQRLSRFFVKEERGFRIAPELRTVVVFTVQDVLADPPFSRLDMVSCRNLLIYMLPEAQAKIVSLFHFALRERGILMLGTAETIGGLEGRFEPIAEPERLYRHIRLARAGELGRLLAPPDASRPPPRPWPDQGAPSRDLQLAELCRRVVLETFAPACVLTTRNYEYLYSLGPVDRYLRVAPGAPTHDLLAMVRPGLRTRIRAAVHEATETGARALTAGGGGGAAGHFSIAVQPVQNEGEALLLICFLDEPVREAPPGRPAIAGESRQIAELEQELVATDAELQGAIRNMEIAADEQRIAHEEALSINEEFQSTNEELLTSKEELQSLNEELTALNTQLQETLEQQRTTSNDLQNILYSTNVATLFLDRALKIRFFTPATRSLFNVMPHDIGRPLRDLASLATDHALPADARQALDGGTPIDREVETEAGIWFARRILPYRTEDNAIEGVVITFTDVTDSRRVADAAQSARSQAELANVAKSRFLAAASHDLRQPLQSIALVQGLLAQVVRGERAQTLVARLDDTLGAMSGMLNALLDINQLEVGAVQPAIVAVPVDEVLDGLKAEFVYHAEARGLALRVMPCGLTIETDPRLLSQMIRNLLSNAVKYTERGRLLLGCRRHANRLSIEVWDTGIGIPPSELHAIFDEYHQLANPARERARGLGLGLAIVQRLGVLLGHPVQVRSRPGRGSVFAVEVPLAAVAAAPGQAARDDANGGAGAPLHTGAILVVEDDPDVGDLLRLLLENAGHRVTRAADAAAALALVRRGEIRPDLVVADYNLPDGMDGLQLTAVLRLELRRQIPVIILTGDILAGTVRAVARAECVQLYKPVQARQLTQTIQRLLPAAPERRPSSSPAARAGPVIFVVDDDQHIRDEIRSVLEAEGRAVEDYASGEAFLAAYRPHDEACLLLDAKLPGISGLDVLHRLRSTGAALPTVMITGVGDVAMVVEAMKQGALDLVEKPVSRPELLGCVAAALECAHDASARIARRAAAAAQVAALTGRQREIMNLVLAGHPSKNIAADLGISQRTVENHRAEIMKRTGARSLPELARLAVAASQENTAAAPGTAIALATPPSTPGKAVPPRP